VSAVNTARVAAIRWPAIGGAAVHESPRPPYQQFVRMRDAFYVTGGLAPTDEVLVQLQTRHRHASELLAQWIDERQVICFEWQLRDWIPWFQFNRHSMAPHPQLQPVFTELNAVYDAWELGHWFATPNPWLASQLPVVALMTDLPAVLHAARADRFIANG